MGKYGEPWQCIDDPEGTIMRDCHDGLLKLRTDVDACARRAVDCVNALAAVPDALLPEVAGVLEDIASNADMMQSRIGREFEKRIEAFGQKLLAAAREVQP